MKIEIKNETNDLINLVVEPYLIYYEVPAGKIAVVEDEFREITIIYTNVNLISIYANRNATVSIDGKSIDSA